MDTGAARCFHRGACRTPGEVVVHHPARLHARVRKLTADHATIQALPGILTAVGHVHLTDPQADVTAERMELNVNTEAGVVTHGGLYLPTTNSSISGRLMQRFSEYHYRVKDGSFTNY